MSSASGQSLIFDGRLYSADTLHKAAYRFIDRFAVVIRIAGENIECDITFDDATVEHALLIQDFKKEVLDQTLRSKIASETESIRHLILAHAFARTGLVAGGGQ